MDSIAKINNYLQEFSRVSGIEANSCKSSVLMSGIEDNSQAQICTYLNFPEGSLPMRYLGMHLVSKRLSFLDYSSLISKISDQLQNWQCRKNLSYAGRIQLTKTVTLGIQIYWTSNYILSIKVLEKIDMLCSAFLWGSKIHLVSWIEIYKDKKLGVLGLLSAKIWNYAVAIKMLWMIHSKKDLLWIKWDINQCVLCDNSVMESRNHLFFECRYSSYVWNNLMAWLEYSWRSCSWDHVMGWYTNNLRGFGFMKKLKRMTLSGAVYWIWKERNMRIFQQKTSSPDQLIKEVKILVLLKVLNVDIPEHLSEKIGKL
ncbi:uncharacterized protein LOC109842150 [Asparagus officinalis]|uniref:uncharacterized protein LOC109842150 n=1 Tax=Asparagus officinalis TaxID=4686 RepID=UPI00098E42DD|nr:uncharacterized protein LOC109842150 [Asparagus officinalis]